MGIAVAMLVMLTFLPAMLLIVGRRPFWPFIPHVGDDGRRRDARLLAAGRRPRRAPARARLGRHRALLLVMALGRPELLHRADPGQPVPRLRRVVEGQELIAKAFPAGRPRPTDVVVPTGGDVAAVVRSGRGAPGVAPSPTRAAGRRPATQLAAFLSVDPYSTAAYDVDPELRAAVARGGARRARRRPDGGRARPARRHRARHEAARPDRAA